MRLTIRPPQRGCDSYGCGHWGADRGDRFHRGVDYLAPKDSVVLAPVAGVVTKLGYPYGGDMELRYVEITAGGFAHRLFYVRPEIGLHEDTIAGVTPIGVVQDLEVRYPNGMSNHVHYEIKRDGEYYNPEVFGSFPSTQQV